MENILLLIKLLFAITIFGFIIFVLTLLVLTLIGLTLCIIDDGSRITAFYTYDFLYEEDESFYYVAFVPLIGFRITKWNNN